MTSAASLLSIASPATKSWWPGSLRPTNRYRQNSRPSGANRIVMKSPEPVLASLTVPATVTAPAESAATNGQIRASPAPTVSGADQTRAPVALNLATVEGDVTNVPVTKTSPAAPTSTEAPPSLRIVWSSAPPAS